MKNVYLAAAIIGAVVPYLFFISFFREEGLMLASFIRGIFANGAAGGFTADLLITSFIFWAYLFANQVRRPWLYIGLNLTIGLSCALPLYLYMQAREQEAAMPAAPA